MLSITIPAIEYWDEINERFVNTKEQTLQLEHSLVSLQKWEQRWRKPFLTKEKKSYEETIDYIKCMTITQNVDPLIYNNIGVKIIDQVGAYIEAPMTATWFSDDENKKRPNREIITAEIIYYWMISFNIPFECRKWHLNSLLTLIRVCNEKNKPGKKRSLNDIISRNRALNEARRKAANSKG